MTTPSRRCLACGRTLTHRDSIERGYGPTCYKRIQAASEVNHGWDEVSTLVDMSLADASIKAVQTVLRRLAAANDDSHHHSAGRPRNRCPTCGRPLSTLVEYRDHGTGGLHLPGFAVKQWVWIPCGCGYDTAVQKLGVTQHLIDQELDRQHRREKKNSGRSASSSRTGPVTTTLAEFLLPVV